VGSSSGLLEVSYLEKVSRALDRTKLWKLSGAELDAKGSKAGAIKLRDAGSVYRTKR
jgi:hypothetical protein